MGKNKRNKHKNGNGSSPGAAVAIESVSAPRVQPADAPDGFVQADSAQDHPAEDPAKRVKQVLDAALDGASDEDLSAIEADLVSIKLTRTPESIAKEAEQALALLRIQERRVADREAGLNKREKKQQDTDAELEIRKSSLDEQAEQVTSDRKSVAELKAHLTAVADDLDKREKEIRQRELAAVTGFLEERKQSQNILETELAKLRAEVEALSAQISAVRAQWGRDRTNEWLGLDR